MKKVIIFALLFVIGSLAVYSQDTIVKINGTLIICTITKEDSSSVYFNMKVRQQNVASSVSRAEIAFIKYSKKESKPIFEEDIASLGFGYGQKYGGLGMNLLIYPQRNIGLFAGAGYAFAGVGYNAGAKVRFLRANSRSGAVFYLAGMYGYTTAISVTNGAQYNKLFYGPTFGFGCDLRTSDLHTGYFTIALLFPIRGQEIQDYINELKSKYGVEFKNSLWPVSISIGYRRFLN